MTFKFKFQVFSNPEKATEPLEQRRSKAAPSSRAARCQPLL